VATILIIAENELVKFRAICQISIYLNVSGRGLSVITMPASWTEWLRKHCHSGCYGEQEAKLSLK